MELSSNEEQFYNEKNKREYKCKEVSSYKVFLRFVKVNPETQTCDASAILSKDCYQSWLDSRRQPPKNPTEAFRRALTAHCRGVDGRRAFDEQVEVSLLHELRKKKRWACFEDLGPDSGLIGVQGFPSQGYHEKRKMAKRAKKRDAESNSTDDTSDDDIKPMKKKLKETVSISSSSSKLTNRNTNSDSYESSNDGPFPSASPSFPGIESYKSFAQTINTNLNSSFISQYTAYLELQLLLQQQQQQQSMRLSNVSPSLPLSFPLPLPEVGFIQPSQNCIPWPLNQVFSIFPYDTNISMKRNDDLYTQLQLLQQQQQLLSGENSIQ